MKAPLFKLPPPAPQQGSCAYRSLRNALITLLSIAAAACTFALCAPISPRAGLFLGPLLGAALASEYTIGSQQLCAVIVFAFFMAASKLLMPPAAAASAGPGASTLHTALACAGAFVGFSSVAHKRKKAGAPFS
jgi:hypothetical protein